MPLEPALSYQNEADFTSRFLVPLLRRLGYSVVAEYHGQREWGKDLVFGEIDRFGEVAYHGLQSKYQDSIGQADSEKLIEDCKDAFRHSFRHPNTGAEHRICTFVVANAGSISDNARDNFFAAATNAEHGGAVKLLDGKALLALDRWATIKRVEDVGAVLTGLQNELRYNAAWTPLITTAMDACVKDGNSVSPIERLRTDASAAYIQKPILPMYLDSRIVEVYWHYACCINRFLDVENGLCLTPARVELAKTILDNFAMLNSAGAKVDEGIAAALATLGPLANL